MRTSKPVPRVLVGVRLPVRLVQWMRETAEKRGMTLQSFVEQRLTKDMIRARMRAKTES
jgi:hypothetical protein